MGLQLAEPPRKRARAKLRPFTVEHFRVYCSRLVFDDGERREPEPWQLDYARDVFRGYPVGSDGPVKGGAHDTECVLLVPEGNGKTTFVAQLALYGCDWALRPWIPVGASTRDQAKVLYQQAKGFVSSTPGMAQRFQCFDGYRAIRPLVTAAMVEHGAFPASMLGKRRPGEGIEICPWDPDSNDGAIPYPYFICDELHRHPDMSLWRLWKGKCRKRGAQGLGISTAGEPGSEFEIFRDGMREGARSRSKRFGGTHYRGAKAVMYEFRLADPAKATDPKAVAAINPLSSNTPEIYAEAIASPSFDIGDFKRLACNIPARSENAGISDEDWARMASTERELPEGAAIYGLDIGWMWDTTAIVALWLSEDWDPGVAAEPEKNRPGKPPTGFRVLGEAKILVPPRDGSSLHPDRVKEAFIALRERNPIRAIVMDTTDAKDLEAWLSDDHPEVGWKGVPVIDRSQGNDSQVEDYASFTKGMRDGSLKRIANCPLLTRHAMNAVKRRLPRGDHRFDRPMRSRTDLRKQDRRVIDALTAAGMAVQYSDRPARRRSVYSARYAEAVDESEGQT